MLQLIQKHKLTALGVFITGLVMFVLMKSFFTGSEGFPDVDYNAMCFAGECIPYEKQDFFNKERIDKEIAVTMLNQAQVAMYHRREPQYFPYIKKELKKAGLPEDLVYLAVAESALIKTAVSPAGAAGIWQFMPGTARDFGLRVDDQIDERFDLEKSTQAAIQYLAKLHDQFDNRSLAAAAYNRGENGLRSDLAWQYADSYYDVWLNEETARYVFRIIAIKYLMENRYDFFDHKVLGKQYKLPSTKTVTVNKLSHIAQRARQEGTSFRAIKELNGWIRSNELPEGSWNIAVFE